LIAAPRGFCAGVDRAIRIVELSIEKYGAPVYVRHEIVHNRHVVDALRAKGAIFVEELDDVPDGVPVVFSAHGVPKAVPHKAAERGLDYIDATCPLVSKVHRQAERHVVAGRHILFIGHRGHPEVVGTLGQVPPGTMTLVETNEDAEAITPADPDNLAFLTQTTLSVDDTAQVSNRMLLGLRDELRHIGVEAVMVDPVHSVLPLDSDISKRIRHFPDCNASIEFVEDALIAKYGTADFARLFLVDAGLDWAAALLADFPHFDSPKGE
jgi:(E)-4-hydroxy-3-methyl-but-2-enyl pyrophosphate reductase